MFVNIFSYSAASLSIPITEPFPERTLSTWDGEATLDDHVSLHKRDGGRERFASKDEEASEDSAQELGEAGRAQSPRWEYGWKGPPQSLWREYGSAGLLISLLASRTRARKSRNTQGSRSHRTLALFSLHSTILDGEYL